jgi:hypothetical protein
MSSAVRLVSDMASILERSVRTKAQDLRTFSANLGMYASAIDTAKELANLLPKVEAPESKLAADFATRLHEFEDRYQKLGCPVAATDASSRAYLKDLQQFTRDVATRVLAAHPKHITIHHA